MRTSRVTRTLAWPALVAAALILASGCGQKSGSPSQKSGQPGAAKKDVAEVVLFVGSMSAQNAIDRRQGILDELDGKPMPPPPTPVAAPLQVPAVTLKPGEKPRIAFVTNNASEFWVSARAGFEKAVKECDVEGEFRIPSRGTPEEQKAILEDLVTKKIHAIAVSPKDPDNQTSLLNDIASKAILITQDSDAPKSKRVLYLGSINYLAGRQAGQLIKEVLGAERPIKVVDTRTDETDRARAKANVQDILVSRPNVACLVGLWSYNGPAIGDVLMQSQLVGKVKAVCFDDEDGALQAIANGAIQASVAQKPYEFGYQSVKILAALVRGDKSVVPPSRQIDVGLLTLRKDNVGEYIKWKSGLLKK